MLTASMANTQARTFLFAGGGSGGHIAPALAIAERLAEADPAVRTHFACSRRAIDAAMLRSAGASFTPLDAAPLHKTPAGVARFIAAAVRARAQAKQLIRSRHIDHVVLLGGFVAAPVAAAARALRVPVTLVNLDLPPGKANRFCARYVTDIISAIPAPPADPDELRDELAAAFRATVVATPVRRRALPGEDRSACRRRLGLDPDRPMLLVTGASQGSTSINELMTTIARRHPDWFAGWQILHLAGRSADPSIKTAYSAAQVPAVVLPFLDQMGDAWGAADLAITRGGANSVAEVAAAAVPALVLPYPWHRDRHQWRNAEPLADVGGAIICDDRIDVAANCESIGPVLHDLLTNEPQRRAMRRSLQAHRPGDGAAAIARHLLGSPNPPASS